MSCDIVLTVVEETFEILEVVEKGLPGTSGVTVHNDLTGKQGGDGADEFYHLTEAQHANNALTVDTFLNNGSSISGLSGAGGDLFLVDGRTFGSQDTAADAVYAMTLKPDNMTTQKHSAVRIDPGYTAGKIVRVTVSTGVTRDLKAGDALLVRKSSAIKLEIVASDIKEVGTGSAAAILNLYANQLDIPNNADWVVNAIAPTVQDDLNNGIAVVSFDDTIEQGRGFNLNIPSTATSVKFTFLHRAKVSPGAAKGIVPKLYGRIFTDGAALGAWTAGVTLTALSVSDATWAVDTETVTLATLGWTAGKDHQIEITRATADGGDDLINDWDFRVISLEFI